METREPGEGFALINDWSVRSWSLVDLRQTKLSPEDLRGKVLSNPKLAGSPYAPTLAIFSLLLAIAATALGLCGGHIGGSSFLSAAGGVISTASQWAIWACVPLLAMSGVLAIFSMRRVRRLREAGRRSVEVHHNRRRRCGAVRDTSESRRQDVRAAERASEMGRDCQHPR